MEFVLEHSKPERTEAMKASYCHAQLEQEVSFAVFFCHFKRWFLSWKLE
jgi:hypothetical protein